MRVRDIRPGMAGYAVSVFQGTKRERFDIKVIGVLHNDADFLGSDLVLIRMLNGPVADRQANMLQGISGSPVYINGRLLGAISAGFPYSKEPQGLVTPIESMLEGLDDKLPPQPLYASLASALGGETASVASVFNGTADNAESANPMAPQHLITPIFASGLSSRTVASLNRTLGTIGPHFASGMGSSHVDMDIPFEPGSMVGAGLAIGDIELTAYGTVTYRKGDKILAFGHPFYGLGGVEFPMTTASVADIVPSFNTSFKLPSTGRVIGTIVQDRPWSIAGVVGRMPKLVDTTINVNDRSTGRKRTFHVQVVNHPLLSPLVTSAVTDDAIGRVRNSMGDTMARVRVEVDAEGLKPIVRENTTFSQGTPSGFAVNELESIADVLSGTSKIPRYPIKTIKVDVDLTAGRRTLVIERAELEKDRLEPGETARVNVTLRPWRGQPYVETVEVPIPANSPNGRTAIAVSGGQGAMSLGGISLSSLLGTGGSNEENIEQAIRYKIEEKDRNDQLIARLYMNTPSLNVGGEKLLGLPLPIAEVMRSQKVTGQRPERDERKVVKTLDGVVSGPTQMLSLIIERRSHAEKGRPTVRVVPAGPSPSGPPQPSSASAPGAPTTLAALPDEDDDAEVVGDMPYLRAADAPKEPAKPKDTKKADPKSGNKGTAKPVGTPEAPAPSPPPTPPSTPPPPSGSDAKGPGRVATLWTQRTKADFELGYGSGAAVSSDGAVVLMPKVQATAKLPEDTYVWSCVSDGKQGLYLGTGNAGRIYHQAADGKVSLLFDTKELEVHSLVTDQAGNLYAATSPHGILFKVTPDGKGEPLYKTGEPYLLSLAVGQDGTLYAGSGPNGRIFKITSDGKGTLLCETKEEHVLSLAVDPQGNLLAGTSPNGFVLRITPTGKSSVLLDTSDPSVTAVAAAADGTVYAGTAPAGLLYRVSAKGDSHKAYDAPAAIMALALDGSGNAYAASGSDIYRVSADDVVTQFDSDQQGNLLSLATDGQGGLVASSGNPAAVLRVPGNASQGSFDSAVRDAGAPARWGRIQWQCQDAKGARVTLQTRTGNSSEPDESWSSWSKPYTQEQGTAILSPPARYLQYRATLEGTKDAAPRLLSVTASYLPDNQPPTVSFSAPQAGDVWSGKQTIRWSGSDPDKDSLTYELWDSTDGGATWKPIKNLKSAKTEETTKVEPAKPAPKTDERPKTVEAPTAESLLSEVSKEIEKDKTLSEDDKQLLNSMLPDVVKSAIEAPPAKSSASGAPASGDASKPLTETSFSWDTSDVPDGEHYLKIQVSDKRSNPLDALSQEKIVGPVVVSNEKPKLLPRGEPQMTDGVVTLEGTAKSSRLPIVAVSFRVSDGDWSAAAPVDGMFDSPSEGFRLVTEKLAAGDQTIEIRAVDSANNVGTQKVTVKVK
jgi:hypothetical protein